MVYFHWLLRYYIWRRGWLFDGFSRRASAPALFQRAMDSILQGIAGVICYIDDILVTGKDDAQHLQALEQVLSRLQEAGLTIQKNKCVLEASC